MKTRQTITFAALIFGALMLAGCGDYPDPHGVITGKDHQPYSCDTELLPKGFNSVSFNPDRFGSGSINIGDNLQLVDDCTDESWSLTLQDGNQVSGVDVDEDTYNSVKVGDYYGTPPSSIKTSANR